MDHFTPYGFKDTTLKFITLNGFIDFTPVQQQVIPLALKGRDIIGISATGTGKTHAFLIPLMEIVDPKKPVVQAVITAPTRELALQLFNNAKLMMQADPALRVKLISGGTNRQKASEKLSVQPHIVIGTPGRIKDMFLNDASLLVNTAKIMIVDEGDMTLEYGFLNDIDAIAGNMGADLQMMVFSATVPQGIKPFLKKYMRTPKTVRISSSLEFSPQINHILVPCKHKSYAEKLLEILPGFQPYICLIFANTRTLAHETANALRDNHLRVLELHGDLTARARKQALNSLNNNEYTYIVATDIASRGLDIDSVTHVVSLGFPTDLSFYIHRSGRTGRAGREGTCFALYNERDDRSIRDLLDKGVHFTHRNYRDGRWFDLKPYTFVRKRKRTELDTEISKIVRKETKVKPGYKKKRKEAIAKLKQQKRRELIREEIRKQKKERAIAKKREIKVQ